MSFGGAAAALWCLAMAACFLVGVALLPVRRDVRWLIVIVAALDWPLLYSVKLGQVEPLLFLGFAAAWRWMDRASVVGGVQGFSSKVLGDMKTFTSGITNKTNPVPVSTSSSSGYHGGGGGSHCACACACAGCACACAGGGR